MYTTAQTATAALQEGFYLGIAYAHVLDACDLLCEYRKSLPLGHAQADSLRQLARELTRIVEFRTATGPADDRSVKVQVEAALSIAHIYVIEAGGAVARTSKEFRAIDRRVVRARRTLMDMEVAL